MAAKVNLKKYLAIDGKWQFAPILKVNSKPEPQSPENLWFSVANAHGVLIYKPYM
jgi:hypothetical protein